MNGSLPELDRHAWFRAYGLLFSTSIAIPEMLEAADAVPGSRAAADVVIDVGDVPESLPAPLATSPVHEVNAESFLLRVAGVGRYLITGGQHVLIDPEPAATPHDVRVYLLGTSLGVLLHQRGFLVLHASGIATERGAVLFAGHSGFGKSTLLAELLSRGYAMMVDDVCAVTFDGRQRPIVVPSYPRTRVWADAAAAYGIDTSELPRTRAAWDKFERQVPEQFCDQEAELVHIFHLAGTHDGADFAVERLGPIQAFTTLVHHTYRGIVLDGLDLRADHFRLASQAVRASQVTRVHRPAGSFRVRELADLVLDILEDAVSAAHDQRRSAPTMTAITAEAQIQRRSELLANDLSATETVMLDVAGGTYFGLRDVGKAIWDHLDTPTTLDMLCERLGTQFDVDPDTCRRDTIAFLETLHEQGLIVVTR